MCEGMSHVVYMVTGYTCALQKDILYQGKMFVSDNWICFHSKVFGRDTKVCSQRLYYILLAYYRTVTSAFIFSDCNPSDVCHVY